VRELPARGPCLGQQFRDRELQQVFGKQEPRLERETGNGRIAGRRIDRAIIE
jgi:hypothetical protein